MPGLTRRVDIHDDRDNFMPGRHHTRHGETHQSGIDGVTGRAPGTGEVKSSAPATVRSKNTRRRGRRRFDLVEPQIPIRFYRNLIRPQAVGR